MNFNEVIKAVKKAGDFVFDEKSKKSENKTNRSFRSKFFDR